MKPIKKYWFNIIFVFVMFLISIYSIYGLNKTKIIYKDRNITCIEYKDRIIYRTNDCNNSLLSISKQTLKNDIQKYKGISRTNKQVILDSIFKYSKQYNINPLIIYSIIATESSFRFWIRHSIATITIKNKKIQTRAIGLSAVMWEWWGDKLKQNHIAEVKSDLYSISTNIQACCYIYSQLLKEPKYSDSKTKEESAMLRYFGGGSKNKWYVNKINKVLSELMKQELYKGE